MGLENAFAFISQLEALRELPPAILLAGPQPFLKEYTLDACRIALAKPGREVQRFQLGGGDEIGAILEALGSPGLFSPAVVALCRVLKTHRPRAAADDDGEESGEGGAPRTSEDGGLLKALALVQPPSHLVIVHERDSAPAKLQREVEKAGLVIICQKPFESQLAQWALLFARRLGLKLDHATAEIVAARFGSNLLGMHNALWLASLMAEHEQPEHFLRQSLGSDGKTGELFQISESLTAGNPTAPFALIERALGIGRDGIELLAVEVLPALRRMLAAAILARRGESQVEVAMALKMSPRSPLLAQALRTGRHLGERRLSDSYRKAIGLDAGFKNGTVHERGLALCLLLAELLEPHPRRATG